MVDTHAHLGLCGPSEGELVDAASEAGVRRILTVGLGEDSNPAAVAAAASNGGVFASVGRHPNSADGFDEGAAEVIEQLCGQPGVVAVGETGLDFYRDRVRPGATAACLQRPDRDRTAHRQSAGDSPP